MPETLQANHGYAPFCTFILDHVRRGQGGILAFDGPVFEADAQALMQIRLPSLATNHTVGRLFNFVRRRLAGKSPQPPATQPVAPPIVEVKFFWQQPQPAVMALLQLGLERLAAMQGTPAAFEWEYLPPANRGLDRSQRQHPSRLKSSWDDLSLAPAPAAQGWALTLGRVCQPAPTPPTHERVVDSTTPDYRPLTSSPKSEPPPDHPRQSQG